MDTKNDSAMEITGYEFDELINNSHKLVVVDFYTEWCMPCLMIAPVIEELANEMKEIKFVKINLDDNHELANKYKVKSIPCLIIFKGGNEVGRIVGAQTKENIEKKIRGH